MQFGLLTAFVLLPLVFVFMDGAAGLHASNMDYKFGNHRTADYTILIPIWGRMRYLETVEYLQPYGHRVMLCTTGDETEEFYTEFHRIAAANGFQTFVDAPRQQRPKRHKRGKTIKRATSGTTRDRVIRNALMTVETTYAIPLDADSTTTEPLDLLAGELERRELDIASIRLVPRDSKRLLGKLQMLEYQLAMRLRFVAPWMISGACHVAKTSVLRDIMQRHSLFFQGNDVETGVIAHARKYTIGHIPFDVLTTVPDTLKPWWRQRLAWGGGETRLFWANIRFVFQHPWFWFYGGIIAILFFPLRWMTLLHPSYALLSVFGLYLVLVIYLHRKNIRPLAFVMPLYTLFSSLVLTPIGVLYYPYMALRHGNWGVIKPNRETPVP